MVTLFKTSDDVLNALWQRMVESTLADFGVTELDGQQVTMGPAWLRDHVHELKGYKYLGADLTSGLDFFFRHQLPDGQFPDFFMPIGDQHADFVTDAYKVNDPIENRVFIRIPVEADLEYLAVEGVYQAWQASGDKDWMQAKMKTLERGLHHLTTDRFRWDPDLRLVVRPHTTDTWDYTFFYDDDHFLTNCEIRRLDETVPLCVFHGDNSGLYMASLMLAHLYGELGESARAADWESFASGVRKRANDLLWGKGFFIHQYHLDPIERAKWNEEDRLSLSNTYDINRGFTTHQQAVSIIDAFRRRWEQRRDHYFAEWFTIEPPYDMQIAFFKPGQYTNGGLFTLTGAELAKAAFNHGREEYGVDILHRYWDFIKTHTRAGFIFYPDGSFCGGGPEGWPAAAYISAMMEGLAGVNDLDTRFKSLRISPRWAAAAVTEANIVAHYPASGQKTGYAYRHSGKEIIMDINGDSEMVSLNILLPKGSHVAAAKFNGRDLSFSEELIESSRYARTNLPEPVGEVCIMLND